jgi:hypothetical protein
MICYQIVSATLQMSYTYENLSNPTTTDIFYTIDVLIISNGYKIPKYVINSIYYIVDNWSYVNTKCGERTLMRDGVSANAEQSGKNEGLSCENSLLRLRIRT